MSPYDLLIEPFADFDFMRRALLGGAALSLGASPIGVFLVLRRMSLVGDAMAHAILPGAAVAFLIAGLSLGTMAIGGLGGGIIVAVLAGLLTRGTQLRQDAALAAFYIVALAAGVAIVSLRGSNLDLLHILFGSILSLDEEALTIFSCISTLTLITMAFIYRPLVLDCVDPEFLQSVGRRASGVTQMIFLGLLVLNLVGGFLALGTMLAVGILMLPAIAARFWASSVPVMVAVAIVIGIVAEYAGLLLSYHLSLPTGPTIILAGGGLCLLSFLFGAEDGLVLRLLPRRKPKFETA